MSLYNQSYLSCCHVNDGSLSSYSRYRGRAGVPAESVAIRHDVTADDDASHLVPRHVHDLGDSSDGHGDKCRYRSEQPLLASPQPVGARQSISADARRTADNSHDDTAEGLQRLHDADVAERRRPRREEAGLATAAAAATGTAPVRAQREPLLHPGADVAASPAPGRVCHVRPQPDAVIRVLRESVSADEPVRVRWILRSDCRQQCLPGGATAALGRVVDAGDLLHLPSSAAALRLGDDVGRLPDEATPDLRQLCPARRLRPGHVQPGHPEHSADVAAGHGGPHLQQDGRPDVQVVVDDVTGQPDGHGRPARPRHPGSVHGARPRHRQERTDGLSLVARLQLQRPHADDDVAAPDDRLALPAVALLPQAPPGQAAQVPEPPEQDATARAAVRLPRRDMRPTLLPQRRTDASHPHPHRPEAVPVPHLHAFVQSQRPPDDAHPHAHRRETVPVRRVRPQVRSQRREEASQQGAHETEDQEGGSQASLVATDHRHRVHGLLDDGRVPQ